MRIETVSYLKKHAADLQLDEPLIVTQNGKPRYVIESYEERRERDEAIALLKLLSFAVKDVEEGEVMSGEELRDGLKLRLRPE